MTENNITLGTKEIYRNNQKLKALGIEIPFTEEQVKEYVKCSKDPIYFITNYVYIVTLDSGLAKFKLWPFQKKMVKMMHENRFVIYKLPRQVGKTTTVLAYFLWLTLFVDRQSLLIAANKRQVAEDILEKYKIAYENVPLWMQQGVHEWNKGNIELENGSKIRASSTTSGAARSGSYNIVLLDEFAHVQPRIANDFYTSVYPVITSGTDTKIFMISTPKGMNLFYKFWQDAQNKKNQYLPFQVHWSEVPGRDQKWYEETISNIGEQQFEQEFNVEFLGSTNTLINGRKLQTMVYESPKEKRNDVDIYETPITEVWDEDAGKQVSIDHTYVIIVDTSEGKGQDYHAFTVIDITQLPYRVVAKYRNNEMSHILLPSVIANTGRYYNNAYVLIEIQTTGMQVAQSLQQDLDYENILWCTTGNKKSQQVTNGHTKNAAFGVKTTKPVRDIGCANLKTLIETDQLIVKDFEIYQEFTTFSLSNTGKYEADGDDDNDDLVMSLVLFGWLTSQKYFKDLTSNVLRKALKQQFIEYSDEEMLPEFKMDDGLPDTLVQIGDQLWSEYHPETNFHDPYGHYFQEFKNRL
jgi:hypothetical protein